MTPVFSRQELESRIAELQTNILTMLAPYEPRSAVGLWLDMLRGIEEVINLPTVDWDDDAFERLLYAFPVRFASRHVDWFMEIRKRLVARFSETFANRISNLVFLGDAIASSLAIHGFEEAGGGFDTLASLVGYLQSRRRHFVGLLHVMPTACRGSAPVQQFDSFGLPEPRTSLATRTSLAWATLPCAFRSFNVLLNSPRLDGAASSGCTRLPLSFFFLLFLFFVVMRLDGEEHDRA